jgi:hypothetical protein
VNEGEQRIYAIEGLDDDLDELVLTVLPGGFHFADVGMTFEVLEDVPGSYKAQMKWDAQCSVYDFSEMTHFEIKNVARGFGSLSADRSGYHGT